MKIQTQKISQNHASFVHQKNYNPTFKLSWKNGQEMDNTFETPKWVMKYKFHGMSCLCRNWSLSPHGVLGEVVKRCRNHVFMTMRKTMNTKLPWLNRKLHLVWFLYLYRFKMIQKKNPKIITCMKVFFQHNLKVNVKF